MAASLSNPVDNLTEGIRKIKCKGCDCLLEYESVKENLIKYKCLSCDKDYSNKIDEELKNRFKNTLLRKGVYPYEYMDEWEKFNEATFVEKEELYVVTLFFHSILLLDFYTYSMQEVMKCYVILLI